MQALVRQQTGKRERDEGEGEVGDGFSGVALPSTDLVQESELARLRAKAKQGGTAVPVPRWAYAALASSLKDKALFLTALRAYHAQVGGAGGAVMASVDEGGLLQIANAPSIDLHALFHAVANAGGPSQLQGDPDWRRIGFVPGVLAASRAALSDVAGLPAFVKRNWQMLLSGFELVGAAKLAALRAPGQDETQ
jgi:hypothetical protein